METRFGEIRNIVEAVPGERITLQELRVTSAN
jgi:hypothetical protein